MRQAVVLSPDEYFQALQNYLALRGDYRKIESADHGDSDNSDIFLTIKDPEVNDPTEHVPRFHGSFLGGYNR